MSRVYRIVEDVNAGEERKAYLVQRKGWLWGWNDCHMSTSDVPSSFRYPMRALFETLPEARAFIAGALAWSYPPQFREVERHGEKAKDEPKETPDSFFEVASAEASPDPQGASTVSKLMSGWGSLPKRG